VYCDGTDRGGKLGILRTMLVWVLIGEIVNKTIWEYYHTIIDIIVDGFGLGSP